MKDFNFSKIINPSVKRELKILNHPINFLFFPPTLELNHLIN